MAADMKISNAAAIAALDAVVDLLDAGAGAGVIKIYDASVGIPADADAANTNNLLATLTCNDPAFGNAADNTGKATATANAITKDSSATGGASAAAFFRAEDSNGTVVIQGTVGTSDADLILNTTTITAGVEVTASAWTVDLTEG